MSNILVHLCSYRFSEDLIDIFLIDLSINPIIIVKRLDKFHLEISGQTMYILQGLFGNKVLF